MQRFMGMFDTFADKYLYWLRIDWPKVNIIDLIEILIICVLIYSILVWMKNSRAWVLLKGIAVIVGFCFIAAIFQMNTILWIVETTLNVVLIAIVVVFQPELRRALESLGRKNLFSSLLGLDSQKNQERFSDKTVTEIVEAAFEMSKTKTGALIVVEQDMVLTEYERTGIALDSLISRQLLVNIFEHNTPLHDGAIIVRGDRIVSATCYLPLSDNMELSKELGTRHRAAVGVSEVTDAMVVIVSEENGNVSLAVGGQIFRNMDPENLKRKLGYIQNQSIDTERFKVWRRRPKDVDKNKEISDR